MKKIVPMLAISSTVFFWGSSFPAMSFLLETSNPFILAAGRFSLAAFFTSLIDFETAKFVTAQVLTTTTSLILFVSKIFFITSDS